MPRKSVGPDSSDRQVVEAFLARFKGWSGPQIQIETGNAVTQSDVSRWRIAIREGSEFPSLTESKRQAMLAQIAEQETDLPAPHRKRLRGALAQARALVRELEALAGEASSQPPSADPAHVDALEKELKAATPKAGPRAARAARKKKGSGGGGSA